MRLRLLVPCIGALVIAACGGANATDIFNSSDGGASTTDGGSTSADGSSGSDSSTTDGGPKTDGSNPIPGASDPGLVACGGDSCIRTGAATAREICCFNANGQTTCQNETLNACTGSRLLCDEKADCENGICCAEASSGDRIQTRCLPTCVTGAQRYQVCKTDKECESGSCKAYDCGPDVPPLKFCQRPQDCK